MGYTPEVGTPCFGAGKSGRRRTPFAAHAPRIDLLFATEEQHRPVTRKRYRAIISALKPRVRTT